MTFILVLTTPIEHTTYVTTKLITIHKKNLYNQNSTQISMSTASIINIVSNNFIIILKLI